MKEKKPIHHTPFEPHPLTEEQKSRFFRYRSISLHRPDSELAFLIFSLNELKPNDHFESEKMSIGTLTNILDHHKISLVGSPSFGCERDEESDGISVWVNTSNPNVFVKIRVVDSFKNDPVYENTSFHIIGDKKIEELKESFVR